VLIGIVLVAVNLRTAVAALSPILTEVNADIPLDAVFIGVLGMLPPVCFAVFGIVASVFARRLGLEPALILALVTMVVGHLVRGVSGSITWLIIGSVVTVQGVGYTLGVLHQATASWKWPLVFLLATGVAISLAGAVISRPHLLEDDLQREA